MTGELHATVEQRLRQARQRYTTARRDLVSLLVAAGRPVTIAEIVEGGGQSQSSVYRNLQLLEQAGSVRRIVTTTEAGARYELNEDLTSHHHHLICHVCGSVEDFAPSRPVERALDALSDDVSGAEGFTTDHHRLDLVGTCAGCR